MSTEAFSKSYNDWLPSTEVFYPKGCNIPNTIDFDWNLAFIHEGTRYLPEHRAYPGKDELLNNLTGRDFVYTSHAEMGKQFRDTFAACPHGGIHGQVKTRSYYSSVAGHGLFDYDYNALKTRNLWADAVRRKLQNNRVNLASSVAEYRESANLFYKTALMFRDIYRITRLKGVSKLLRQRRKHIKVSAIPASILQYNFGVAPLVGDLFSVVEALRLKLEAPILCRTSASVKKRRENVVYNGGGFEYYLTDTFKQRATIYYDMNPDSYLSSQFDLGNPVEWAWELIPFSFMVDWVIPIGGFLNNLDALTGISNIRGTLTTKVDQRYKARWYDAQQVAKSHTGYFKSYERSTIASVPHTWPSWDPSPSWMKIVNASSILASLRLNIFKSFTDLSKLKKR